MNEWFIPGLGIVSTGYVPRTGTISIEVDIYAEDLAKVGVEVEEITCGECGHVGAAIPNDYRCLECRELSSEPGFSYNSDLPWLLERAGLKKPA